MTQTPENQQQYGSILTVAGENAEQNGKLQNKQITFTHIAIGDANDSYVQPDRMQSTLVNELARIPVNSVDVLQPTPDSVPMLKVEAILPDNVNDLIIREFAAVAEFNGNTYFHAVGNCARIYVPPPVNNGNVLTPVTLEMIFVITSAEPIIEIDPNVVTASREWASKQDLENLAKSLSIPVDNIDYWKNGEVIKSRDYARVHKGVVYSAYLSSNSNPITCDVDPDRNFIVWGLHKELINTSESFNVKKTTLLRTGESLDGFNAVVHSDGVDGERWFYLPESIQGSVESVNVPEIKTEYGTFLLETSNQNQYKKNNDIRGWILPEDPALQIDAALERAYSEKSVVKIPATKETYLYSKTLDLTNKDLVGEGLFASKLKWNGDSNIDQIYTNSSTSISDLFLHGGWDGATTDLSGDIIRAESDNFGGDLRLNNVRLLNAPRDMVRMSKFGYSVLNGVVGNAAGRHGLHLDGEAGGTCTTVEVTGQSKLSDCPFGFGVRIYNGHNITLGGASSTEYTKGVELAGLHNRVIKLSSFYNEFGPHQDFLTLTGSGMGLVVEACFGGGKKIDFNYNWHDVRIGQNSNLAVPDNAHSWEVSTGSESMFGALSCLLGLKAKNISGASPANSSDSAPLAGYQKLIHAFMNNGVTRAGITAEGGIKLGGGTWDSPYLGLGDWAYIFRGTGNELRIKFGGLPTGPNDGQVFQLS